MNLPPSLCSLIKQPFYTSAARACVSQMGYMACEAFPGNCVMLHAMSVDQCVFQMTYVVMNVNILPPTTHILKKSLFSSPSHSNGYVSGNINNTNINIMTLLQSSYS